MASKVEEYRKQQKAIDELKQAAIAELQGLVEEAEANLRRLEVELDELRGTSPKPSKTVKPAKREIDPNKPCSVCNYVTIPPHDARSHRTQDPKKPFTPTELKEKGWEKVK